MRRIANPPKQIGVKYYIILFYNKEFITTDFQWHRDVISKELTGAQPLRHLDIRTIYLGSIMGDGMETDVALQCRGNPTADDGGEEANAQLRPHYL